jgi:polysaccharide biosynthesis protein PslH
MNHKAETVPLGDALNLDGSSKQRLHILWLSPYLPLPLSGAGSRVFHLIKALARRCDIDLVATTNEWHVRHEMADELRALCMRVEIVDNVAHSRRDRRMLQLRSLLSRHPAQYWTMYSAEMQKRIDQLVRDHQYDLAIAEHSFTGYYRLPSRLPIVVDQHNVESEIMQRASQQDRSAARRALNRVEFLKYRIDERWICRQADLLLAVSERDRAAMQEWGSIPECRVIPNGVDTQSFSQELYPGSEVEGSILFTGTLHYGPNTEAVLYFGRDVWPLVRQRVPAATFTVIGAHPPPRLFSWGSARGSG